MDRRQFVLAGTGLLTALAGCNGDGTPTTAGSPSESPSPTASPGDGGTDTEPEPPEIPDSVGLEPVATGLGAPLDMVDVPDSDLQYVAQQGGVVSVIEGGSLRSTPLLDIGGRLSGGYEKGLLGIALHPNFAENRRLFVRYSAPPNDSTPDDYSHRFILAEFEVGADGYQADPDSRNGLLTIDQPQANHNAGSVLFGPDGYLYVGVGDGGAGGDQGPGHVDDWYDAVNGGNGQDVTENLLGSILRLDVDDRSPNRGYSVPEDNPLVGEDGLDEQYAWGLRNPWRLAFDGEDLYAGDVGQQQYEEVDLVEKGGNYGWNVKEATHCYGADSCPDGTPPDVRGGEPLLDPVIEYPHGDAPVSGVSVIAGNVYRGDELPSLQGRFLFGDLATDGRLFVAHPRESGLWETEPLPIADGDAGNVQQLFDMERIGGEMYVLGRGADGGGVFRVVA